MRRSLVQCPAVKSGETGAKIGLQSRGRIHAALKQSSVVIGNVGENEK